ELGGVGRAAGAGVLLGVARDLRGDEVAEAGHTRRRQRAEGAEQVLAPVAEADDGDVQAARRPHRVLRTRNTPCSCARTQRPTSWAIAQPTATARSAASPAPTTDTRPAGQPRPTRMSTSVTATSATGAPPSARPKAGPRRGSRTRIGSAGRSRSTANVRESP